jgi:CarboxypepD_reg-like domain/Bacterial Ig-like domain (group 2)/Protein of unknown function (DUF3761)
MRRWLSASSCASLLAIIAWACGGGSTPPSSPSNSTSTTPSAPTVTAVAVSGTAPNVGATAQFAANATFSNGTNQVVTSQAAWQSSATGVAPVNAAGVVSGVAAGEADITATYQTVSGKMHVAVAVAIITVSGTVTDATSGTPLSGIIVAGAGKSVMTDASGRYSMAVPAGGIGLVASGTGFVTTEKILTVTADTRVDFVLARAATPTPTPSPTPGPIAAPGLPSKTPASACSLDSIVHPASCINNSFGNATAICNDGARSCSASNSGTCSSHSGVYCWVCPGALCPQ